MLALLEPDKGNIYIYNKDNVLKASPSTRGNFIYVPQGNTLISGTILDNLRLGRPDATQNEIRQALHYAMADFVWSLSDGLNTACGESGAGLSEGQAQTGRHSASGRADFSSGRGNRKSADCKSA